MSEDPASREAVDRSEAIAAAPVEALEPGNDDRPSQSPASLVALARDGARRAGIGLLVLLVALGLATKLYQEELLGATAWVFDTIGASGLGLLVLVADGIVSPVPPDLVLIAVAKSELPGSSRWALVAVLGVVSVIAGNLGFLLAARLQHSRLPGMVFGRAREKSERLIKRFGKWAIAVGALTPVPFSITCWAGGLLGMPWRVLAPMTLLRIPRFIVYYAAINGVEGLLRSLAH